MHGLSGFKPDWLSDINLLSVKHSNIISYNDLSMIFPVIRSNDIAR